MSMEFIKMRDKLIEHFNEMSKDVTHLFETNVDKDKLWDLYLNSFPPGTNEIYRERREYDCNCCRQFVRNFGNAVMIKDNKVITIWDFECDNPTFKPVIEALSSYIKENVVSDVYVSKFKTIGIKENLELTNASYKKWSHFYITLPDKFVDKTGRSEGDIKGSFRDVRNVFKRSLDEITRESVETVLELIYQNSLYKGEEWKMVLEKFLLYKKEYEKVPVEDRNNYAWEKSIQAGSVVGKIRNHSMGTLLVNISEGMDLDTAVKKYEQIVAPSNYKRPKGVYTKKMLEDAKKTMEEMGYMESLPRRFATLDDITVNNILFSNKDSAKRIGGGTIDIFGEMEKEVSSKPKKFSKVEEIDYQKFVNDVLPTAREVEVYLENKHTQNMVSLIAPVNKDAKSMFKWDNNFGWAYAGNVTDSLMKERVKAAGGKVDGDLRFSIQWNDVDYDPNDLDAHCIEPKGYEIYYGNRSCYSPSRGKLDVDIIEPRRNIPAVENITYSDRKVMKDGTYRFFVNCFSFRGGCSGFRAEIEFDGQIYSFNYNQAMRYKENIQVAEVTLKNGEFTIKEMLPSNVSSKEVWGLNTNQFVPVSVICYSPNYWNSQEGIGHRHVFFMLKNCINPETPNGFFNEYLKQELYEHRKVFEALGSKMRVEDSVDQLSGIGFSTTKRGEIIVKVKGNTERILKVKF